MPLNIVPEERDLVFRFGDLKDGEVTGPTIIRQVLMDRGWRVRMSPPLLAALQRLSRWHPVDLRP